MTKFDIVTIGGAVKDYTFYTGQGKIFSTPENLTAQKMIAFEYGAKITSSQAYLTLGGGGANSAVALAKLGFKTAIITRLGKDESGDEILTKLKKKKVNLDFIQRDKKHLTGFSFIIANNNKDRDRTIFHYFGCGELLIFKPKMFNQLQTDWFYLTSLSGENWLNNLKAIFSFAAQKRAKIYWNPGTKQLQAGKKILENFLEQTQVLTLNKDEAIELVLSGVKIGRKNPNRFNRPVYLLNILREWGPKIVVITDGKKGAWAYDGKKIYQQKATQVKVVDATGVGDAFGSGFLAGLIAQSHNAAKALKWGMVNSGSVITKVGAQNGLLSRQEIERKTS